MTRGETLFEIAPLGQMVVEIAVPEEDISHVEVGMEADFFFHAIPNRRWRGTVSKVHPQAEIRDHDNVFVAEVALEDTESLLRPGMRGRARIYGHRHMLGWNLFHKAYYAVQRSVGW